MKKFISEMIFPVSIAAIFALLISASFKSNKLITISRENYIETMFLDEITINTLIIDPGHGGADGGAVSITGGKESEINLQIAKKTDIIAGLFGIDAVLTRDSENIN